LSRVYNNNNNYNNNMNISQPPSGRGGVAATPFRDPFAGTNNMNQYSPSSNNNARNPLHHPLTPNTYNQANRNQNNYSVG
jgi:hypothetical protein